MGFLKNSLKKTDNYTKINLQELQNNPNTIEVRDKLLQLSGVGPNISIKISVTGTVDTDIKSEFIAQGINQTLHRVYVVFDCNMKIITPTKTYEKQVLNQVIIAENVIVGNIPDSYYNLEGFSSPEETLDLIH